MRVAGVLLAVVLGCGCGSNRAPVFLAATHLADTEDTVGPYGTAAFVIDDDRVASVSLYYSTDFGAFTKVPLARGDEDWWRGGIPGQPVGTTVRYYFEAADDGGRLARIPNAGSEDAWVFQVVAT